MSKSLAAERFLADRTAPYCSLDVAKSFAQLRSVCPIFPFFSDCSVRGLSDGPTLR